MHLYGSVTAADVVESLKESPLRKLGIRERNVRLLEATAAASDAAAGAAVGAAAAGGSAEGAAEVAAAAAEVATAAKGSAAAETPAKGAPAAVAAAPAVAETHVYKTVGVHKLLVEPRPGLWCEMTAVVESS